MIQDVSVLSIGAQIVITTDDFSSNTILPGMFGWARYVAAGQQLKRLSNLDSSLVLISVDQRNGQQQYNFKYDE